MFCEIFRFREVRNQRVHVVKGTVSRDFRPFFCLKDIIWAPYEQAKTVSRTYRFREDVPSLTSKITCPGSQRLRRHAVFSLKGQCHEMFCHFLFNESKPSGPLINRLKKWFCLKIRFHVEIRLRAVLACAESDSVQANTERSQKLKCPQIQNWLTLRGVKQIFQIFENLNF